MDMLFAHALGLHGQWQSATGASTPAWAPALDIAERTDAYLVTVELPGVKLDDLEITLEDGLLTIQGERQFTSESSEGSITESSALPAPSAARSPARPCHGRRGRGFDGGRRAAHPGPQGRRRQAQAHPGHPRRPDGGHRGQLAPQLTISQSCSRNIQRIRLATAPGECRRGPTSCRTAPKRGLCIVAATVLVADDDADIVRFVEIYLRLEGFAVVTARDGPDVLAKAAVIHPDLMLLDVLMPGLDGYAVCAQIRAEATLAAVPVIMVTGNYVSADVEAARRVGADDFLVKPFDPLVLLDKAKALLGRATVQQPSWWPRSGGRRSRLPSAEEPATERDGARGGRAATPGSARPESFWESVAPGCAARFGLTVMCEGTGAHAVQAGNVYRPGREGSGVPEICRETALRATSLRPTTPPFRAPLTWVVV